MAKKYLTSIDLNKNEMQNMVLQNLAAAPTSASEGQMYYDTVENVVKVFDGSVWKSAGADIQQATADILGGIKAASKTSGETAEVKIDASTGKLYSQNTTYSVATTSANGLMSSSDKTKLNGISAGATANTGTVTNVAVNSGSGISIAGSPITTSGTITVTNTGVLSVNGNTGAVTGIATAAQLNNYIPTSQKGVANGIASLGSDGKVPESQLPSYVDDVIDAYIVSGSTTFSAGWLSLTNGGGALTPESGKIYIVLSQGDYYHREFRWSGTTYAEVSSNVGTVTSVSVAAGAGIGVSGSPITSSGTITITNNGVTSVNGSTGAITNVAKKFAGTITGDGSTRSFTITHNLNSRDIVVAVYTSASPYDEIIVDIDHTNLNSIVIEFAVAPTTNYRVVVIG